MGLLFSVAAASSISAADNFESAAEMYAALQGYPVEHDHFGRLMVGAHVNGVGPYPFIIDTGASRSIIYRSLTANLGLQAIPNKSRNIITANGYRRALIYPIGDIYALGNTLTLEDTVALPDIPNSVAKGLIGVDLLANKVLHIQPHLALAALLDAPEDLEGEGWDYIQGRAVAHGSVALEIDIGGVMVPLVVDTGASDTVINKAGAETLLRAATGIKSEKASAVVARGRTVARERLIFPSFALGNRAMGETKIYVADVPIFRLLGAGRVPAIILGMDVMGQEEFAVDFLNWRLYTRASSKADSNDK